MTSFSKAQAEPRKPGWIPGPPVPCFESEWRKLQDVSSDTPVVTVTHRDGVVRLAIQERVKLEPSHDTGVFDTAEVWLTPKQVADLVYRLQHINEEPQASDVGLPVKVMSSPVSDGRGAAPESEPGSPTA